jgi:cobalt transporter subunit CbtA
MMIRVLLAAIFAGMLAGAFMTAAQSVRVIPLILEAETYEAGGLSDAQHSHDHGEGQAAAHDHGGTAWSPEGGWSRTFLTFIANTVVGVAYALLLTAAILLVSQSVSLRSGLLWGAGGFAVFVLAPNFGLPPELPGMPAAELVERQIWWVATAAMTAGGLLIFATKRALHWMVAGVALIVAPHLYGAPQPLGHESAIPASLAAEFVIVTVVTSALFWLVLGGLLGSFLSRAIRQEEATGDYA